jgi:hypothetical protein
MGGQVLVPRKFRAARVAALQAELVQKQAELVGLLEDDDLVARAAFEAEIDAIAAAPAPPPPAPARAAKPRRRRAVRRRVVAPQTSSVDIEATRRALAEKGMLPR